MVLSPTTVTRIENGAIGAGFESASHMLLAVVAEGRLADRGNGRWPRCRRPVRKGQDG
jgi:hypothetical protein